MEIMRHTDEGRDNKMKKHSCIILFTMTLIMTMMLSVLTAFAAGKPYRMGFY